MDSNHNDNSWNHGTTAMQNFISHNHNHQQHFTYDTADSQYLKCDHHIAMENNPVSHDHRYQQFSHDEAASRHYNPLQTPKFPSSSYLKWDLDMAVENNNVLQDPHHIHFSSNAAASPNYHPLQTPKAPLSTYSPPVSFLLPSTNDDAMDNVRKQQEEPEEDEKEEEQLSPTKEMMYTIAAIQPFDFDPSAIRKPKRRNVRISDDPQSVAARQRRERISERIRILERIVPGGTQMDTSSMLDEAIRYVKFLKKLVRKLQSDQNPSSLVSNWDMRSDDKLLSTTLPVEAPVGTYYPYEGVDININSDIRLEGEEKAD